MSIAGSRVVFTAGAEQLAAPLLLVFPWEAEPRSDCLLGVRWGWSAASLTLDHNIVDIS